MPSWVAILDAASEWGIPPWQVEDEATQLWWERWSVLQQERSKVQQAKAPKGGKGKAKLTG